MPFYYSLKSIRPKERRIVVIDKLLQLRKDLDESIPAKDAEENLILATWNIRDFDKKNRRGFGKRLPESLFYIAEIISRFDLVAIQEVNRLGELERVMDILGPNWKYIASDVTDRTLGGNGERLTYLYDRRKVWFESVVGEIVLPRSMLISKVQAKVGEDTFVAGKQFRRSPFVASFQSGWFNFDLCTVHLYYGAESGEKLKERVQEIGAIAKYLSERADIRMEKEDRSLILLGDFNIISPEHKTMKALLDNGFVVPADLQKKTNVVDTKYYDQIAFKKSKDVLDYTDSTSKNASRRNAGVFKLFQTAFSNDMVDTYKKDMEKTSALAGRSFDNDLQKYFKTWRTYQISDHNPLWVRLKVNRSQAYLEALKESS